MRKYIYILLGLIVINTTSCVGDLLDQDPTKDLDKNLFWETTDDATKALHGVYNATRLFFHKNYAWDGATDIMWANVRVPYGQYQPIASMGSNYTNHWKNGYQVVNRANYVLENLEVMLKKNNNAETVKELNRIKAETIFLRAITYFRLTDLWLHIPYYTHVLSGNDEAYSLTNISRDEIMASIIKDLDAVKNDIPLTVPEAQRGRAIRASAFGFLGKFNLYWASWKKNEGKADEANKLFETAALNLKEVMDPKHGRALYKNGEAGDPEAPNYGEMFDGLNEYNSEVIFATSNAGPNFGVGLGDTYIYDFGTRSVGAGGSNVTPSLRGVNRYQLISTGDYAPAFVTSSEANKETILNGACNPESYKGRDYRLNATVMWDGQTMYRLSADGMVVGPELLVFRYNFSDNIVHINAQGPRTGYIFRKFVRQYAFGPREEGQQDIYLMRLPDVWLMYCEAINESNNGPTPELFNLVNAIRNRGGLPDLDQGQFGTKDTFFKAIEQERIVELMAEGHRFFDIRRWKMVESLWPQPEGYTLTSTWGRGDWYREEFKNASERDLQRFYIFQIPDDEIKKNSNLRQNDPWL